MVLCSWQHREKGLWQEDRVWVRTLMGAYTWDTLSKKKKDNKLVSSCFQQWGHGFLELHPDILSQWVWYPLSFTMNLTTIKFSIVAHKKAPRNRNGQTHTDSAQRILGMLYAFGKFTVSLWFVFPTWIWRQWHLEVTMFLILLFKVIILDSFYMDILPNLWRQLLSILWYCRLLNQINSSSLKIDSSFMPILIFF